jgi:hypothetical protein
MSAGAKALEACADVMGTELGWGKDRTQDELDDVIASFPLFG